MDLARSIGCDGSSIPSLVVTSPEREDGHLRLSGADVGIQPGTRYPGKQIPLPVLTEVALRLQRDGRRIALVGGPEEAELAEELNRKLTDATILVGKTSIRQSLDVLANLRLTIGGDTGLLHLAAAVGCPTVTAFGPTNSRKWGHLYPPHQVVMAPNRDMSQLDPSILLESAHAVLTR